MCSQGNVTFLHLYPPVFNFFSPSIPVLSFSVSFCPSPRSLFAAETPNWLQGINSQNSARKGHLLFWNIWIYSFAVVYFYCCFLVVSFSSCLLCLRPLGFFFFFSLLKPARFLMIALIILPLCKLKIKIPSHTNTRARAVYTDAITGILRWNAADAFSSSPPVNCVCTSVKCQVCFIHFALLQSWFLPLPYELIRALLFISASINRGDVPSLASPLPPSFMRSHLHPFLESLFPPEELIRKYLFPSVLLKINKWKYFYFLDVTRNFI